MSLPSYCKNRSFSNILKTHCPCITGGFLISGFLTLPGFLYGEPTPEKAVTSDDVKSGDVRSESGSQWNWPSYLGGQVDLGTRSHQQSYRFPMKNESYKQVYSDVSSVYGRSEFFIDYPLSTMSWLWSSVSYNHLLYGDDSKAGDFKKQPFKVSNFPLDFSHPQKTIRAEFNAQMQLSEYTLAGLYLYSEKEWLGNKNSDSGQLLSHHQTLLRPWFGLRLGLVHTIHAYLDFFKEIKPLEENHSRQSWNKNQLLSSSSFGLIWTGNPGIRNTKHKLHLFKHAHRHNDPWEDYSRLGAIGTLSYDGISFIAVSLTVGVCDDFYREQYLIGSRDEFVFRRDVGTLVQAYITYSFNPNQKLSLWYQWSQNNQETIPNKKYGQQMVTLNWSWTSQEANGDRDLVQTLTHSHDPFVKRVQHNGIR